MEHIEIFTDASVLRKSRSSAEKGKAAWGLWIPAWDVERRGRMCFSQNSTEAEMTGVFFALRECILRKGNTPRNISIYVDNRGVQGIRKGSNIMRWMRTQQKIQLAMIMRWAEEVGGVQIIWVKGHAKVKKLSSEEDDETEDSLESRKHQFWSLRNSSWDFSKPNEVALKIQSYWQWGNEVADFFAESANNVEEEVGSVPCFNFHDNVRLETFCEGGEGEDLRVVSPLHLEYENPPLKGKWTDLSKDLKKHAAKCWKWWFGRNTAFRHKILGWKIRWKKQDMMTLRLQRI